MAPVCKAVQMFSLEDECFIRLRDCDHIFRLSRLGLATPHKLRHSTQREQIAHEAFRCSRGKRILMRRCGDPRGFRSRHGRRPRSATPFWPSAQDADEFTKRGVEIAACAEVEAV